MTRSDLLVNDDEGMTLRRLAVSINTSLLKLDRLHQQIDTLRRELDTVLDGYFTQIATHLPWVTLSPPESPTEHMDFNAETIPEMAGLSEHHAQMQQVMQHMYRNLARHCHPDVNPDASPDAMVAVNRAYQQRELGSLMVLAQEMLGSLWHGVAFTRDDMQHYHTTLREMVEAMQSAFIRLQQSDANHLRRRLLMARLHGNDVIAEVAGRLQAAHA
jgi:hypothetical protein